MENKTMNILTIDEHSFCPELLPEKANILDAGCRGFGFTNYFRYRGHDVLAIDIDRLEDGSVKISDRRNFYFRRGIGARDGIAVVTKNSDPQATRMGDLEVGHNREINNNEVIVYSLNQLELIQGGSEFDLIKLDIEGEEVPVLRSIQHPAAKQISVEFHAHTGANTKAELDALLNWLSEWYTIHGAVWEKRHGCSENYWDVLLIAK